MGVPAVSASPAMLVASIDASTAVAAMAMRSAAPSGMTPTCSSAEASASSTRRKAAIHACPLVAASIAGVDERNRSSEGKEHRFAVALQADVEAIAVAATFGHQRPSAI